jgi:DNA-binding MarR family transcriptional regulator
MGSSPYDQLDELLLRIRTAQHRPAWRRRLIASSGSVQTLSTLRVLRAVERRGLNQRDASISDVAEYMAVEHSTASRAVAGVVATGLLKKTYSPDDQRRCVLELTEAGRTALAEITGGRRQMVAETIAKWPVDDIEALLILLERLADDFERESPL